MRYLLKVAYDGTDFCGWQVQANGRTVQEQLNNAVKAAFGVDAVVTASGRTDAGVHALGQVCHVDLPVNIEGERLADALNQRLPGDVSVLCSAVAEEGFDANRSAKRKTYSYSIYCAPRHNPVYDRFSVWVKAVPDIERLREAARLFEGEHDFAAYCASGSQVKTTVRTVYTFNVFSEGDFIKCEVCGNGFLYNMVRTLVGTALWYAYGKLSMDDLKATLTECDRAKTGKTMPAKGLTLKDVEY